MRIAARSLAFFLALALAAAGALTALVLYLGLYDISATDQHTRPLYLVMDYAMRRSVKFRTEDIQVPPLDDAQRIRRGAVHYRAHCVQCHGAPGVSPEPLAFGLTPAPANLVGTARVWPPGEMYWVIRNGIKMTGMPAWIGRLGEEDIWDVVAFVRASVRMTPLEYAALAAQLPAYGHASAQAESGAAPAAAVLGNATAGREATMRNMCVTCHVIPGLVGANRHVGPPLGGVARRSYLGGVVPNTPDNMVRWLQDPQQFDPLSAMPALGLSEQDARDIAAFMYTLDQLAAE